MRLYSRLLDFLRHPKIPDQFLRFMEHMQYFDIDEVHCTVLLPLRRECREHIKVIDVKECVR